METNSRIRFMLSFEELYLVLSLVDGNAFPGMEMEAFNALSDREKATSLLVAERGLRARELGVIDGEGRLLVDRDLLELVKICAGPEKLLAVQHLPAGGFPLQTFNAFFGRDQAVIHFLPQPGLHMLVQMPDWQAARDEAIRFARTENIIGAAGDGFTLQNAEIRVVSEMAGAGNLQKAAAFLQERAVPNEQAQAFSGLLGKAHDVSLFYAGKKNSEGQTVVERLSVIHDEQHGWLMRSDGEEKSMLKPGSSADLIQILDGAFV